MKKIIFILLFFSASLQAQFLKFSTLYISTDISSPLAEQAHYRIDKTTGELTNETEINDYNYKPIKLKQCELNINNIIFVLYWKKNILF